MCSWNQIKLVMICYLFQVLVVHVQFLIIFVIMSNEDIDAKFSYFAIALFDLLSSSLCAFQILHYGSFGVFAALMG